ncbi:MAG: S9 family peptidase [Proteobacteria bacterium]|nr:S9 family peptidase [Pseudomonadota bacterium]
MKILALAALAAVCLCASAFAADTPSTVAVPTTANEASVPPLKDFLRRDTFGAIKISPTGEYLAATVPLSDRTSLVILRRSDNTMVGHVTVGEHKHVTDFQWVTPQRILFGVSVKFGYLDRPQSTFEIFATNADGSDQRGAINYGYVIDTVGHDDKYVLIGGHAVNGYTEVQKMDVGNGIATQVARAPVQNASFLLDGHDVPRFAWGMVSDGKLKTYYRAGADAKWEMINDEAQTGLQVTPIGFAADGKTFYLQNEQTNAPDAIYAFDAATRKSEIVYRAAKVSPAGYLRSPIDGSVYAAVFEDGLPRVEYIDPDNEYARRLRAVQAGFKGAMVLPTSYTRDGSQAVYVVYSDRIPADYYLYDRKDNRLTFLASKAAWFKPDMLAAMKPISLTARDGMPLEGYLTLPRGSDGKNLPLVVNPHGGPFGPFDQWGYNPEVQLLASRGYAVLQLNYRGSGNYGRAFEHAGYRQWGGAMQDDLTDATRWAIAQGIADPKRICIYGASYGGYAALMGVAKEPTLYRCAIGYVGVYDMNLMFNGGDIHESMFGHNFLVETLGEKNLDAISPDDLADRIQVPVMLVAGAEDRRAPFKHTELMRDALQAAHKQVDARIYAGEGHGFYKETDRLDFYTRMLAFLDRNIGAAH